jgi:hypothetical protein
MGLQTALVPEGEEIGKIQGRYREELRRDYGRGSL